MFQCARFQPLSLSFQLTSSPNVFISSSIRLSWYKPQRDNLDLIVILAQDSFSPLGATFHLTVVFSCFDRVRVYCARSLNKQELDSYLISRKKGNSRLYLLWLKCVEPWTKFYVSFPIWPWQSFWLESVVWNTRWEEGLQPHYGHGDFFYGKPTKNALVSNFRRNLRRHLILALWAPVTLSSKWGHNFISHMGFMLDLKNCTLSKILSTVSQSSRSLKMNEWFFFFHL